MMTHMAEALDLSKLSPIITCYRPEGRSGLLPALLEAQDAFGCLSEPVVVAIGQALKVPLAEIHGVIEFYSMLYTQPTGQTIVRICTSPRCAQAGAEEILAEVCRHFGVEPGGTTADGAYTIEEVQCLGLCDHAPAALVGEVPVAKINTDHIDEWTVSPEPASLGVIGGSPRWIIGRCGEIPPTDVEAFVKRGGFTGLRRALAEMSPEQVIDEVKQSGLVGRGGAAFPTGLKWQFSANAEGKEHYIVCNADESEPGTFKDRVLLEGDPLYIIEGMAIAGYAVGASKGYVFARGEYPRARKIMAQAIESARKVGYLGEDILGSGFSFDVELFSGAGAYICGEETALFEAIEGKRGYPRLKPPFPTTHGLFGQPTVINNVETLCAAAWIIANGIEAYHSQGTKESTGTKIFCLSGDIAHPGIYEAPLGTKLKDLLALAGGVVGNLQAILLGGAAGVFASPDQIDVPMSYEGLRDAGLALGAGKVMVINTGHDMHIVLRSIARFFEHESCGKCFPCQLGTQRQLEIIEKAFKGKATKADLEALLDIDFTMRTASLCGLGKTASMAILSAVEKWPELIVKSK
jgi:NADH-quinone oxidoreductase subunit F